MAPKMLMDTNTLFTSSFGTFSEIIVIYYSFKIFPRFWLAKSARIIHNNQLLMTKFERILCLTRKWRQKCSVLAGKGTVNREDLGTRLSCFGCENKKWGTFHSFQEYDLGKVIAKNMPRRARTQLEEISEGVTRLGLRPRRITPSSISIILHKILSLIH